MIRVEKNFSKIPRGLASKKAQEKRQAALMEPKCQKGEFKTKEEF